jgi:aquaporin Z
MHKYLTEFIGTFFLVFTIGLAVLSGSALAPLAIGASLMVMVYMGGHVSGAHYNPAVSLAVFLRGKLSIIDLAIYVVVQLVASIAASAVVYVIRGETFGPAPAANATTVGALLVEILYTFALALVVLNVATAKKTENNSFYGLAIGFTVAAGAVGGGAVSGGAFNPAVGTGPNLVKAIWGSGGATEALTPLWLYWVGPLAGAALASEAFKIQEAGSSGAA